MFGGSWIPSWKMGYNYLSVVVRWSVSIELCSLQLIAFDLTAVAVDSIVSTAHMHDKQIAPRHPHLIAFGF